MVLIVKILSDFETLSGGVSERQWLASGMGLETLLDAALREASG